VERFQDDRQGGVTQNKERADAGIEEAAAEKIQSSVGERQIRSRDAS
jgi:hypothetical protein